jgi:capsular polysaccharide biosynthesis protein
MKRKVLIIIVCIVACIVAFVIICYIATSNWVNKREIKTEQVNFSNQMAGT